MKNLLIIQEELPAYREFLWDNLRENFNLYLADTKNDKLILPSNESVKFSTYVFNVKIDCLAQNSGIKDALKSIHHILKYRASRNIAITQFVGRRKGGFSRLLKGVYLYLFYDHILIYYDHEKRFFPFKKLSKKTTSFNNTVADWNFQRQSQKIKNDFLFIGRFTEKSNLSLLLDAVLNEDEITLHLVGVTENEIPFKYKNNRIHAYGSINDLSKIAEIAENCLYFIYPGDVGLSIIHALKLGLIPVIHSSLDDHMPEARAAVTKYPVIFFQKNDRQNLQLILKLLANLEPSNTCMKIFDSAQKSFSQKTMSQNFINAINGFQE